MHPFFRRKSGIVTLSVIALMALTILSIGLNDLAFRPTLQFKYMNEEAGRFFAVEEMVDRIVAVPFQTHLMIWGILLLIAALVAVLLSPRLRKQFLRTFIRIALIALILVYLRQHHVLSPLLGDLQFSMQPGEKSDAASLPAPPVFQPPQISPILSYILSLGVALLFVGFMVMVNRWWAKQKRTSPDGMLLDDVALIARSSLDDILHGQDWENVIINCYVNMSQVAFAKRGLYRHESMTPGEYASCLKSAGLPADAVRRLTQLFESVRYGRFRSTQKENDEAINCLTAILLYCGETV